MMKTQFSSRFVQIASPLALGVFALLSANCGGSPSGEDVGGGSSEEAMSTVVHTTYGMTTFGGPGDYQALSCGGNSRTAGDWYVASSQRYGCNKHLMLTARGKCAVVRTADAGPASYVEARAGVAVLDSSPALGRYFFGESGLGFSDLRANPGKYEVHVVPTTLPLGPCDGSDPGSSSSSSSSGASSSSSGDTGDTGSTSSSSGSTSSSSGSTSSSSGSTSSSSGSTSSSSGGGASCSSDGDCNPGADGSGLICSSGTCIPGCHHNAQCPGNTTCVSGSCQ